MAELDLTHIARPYASAAFQVARETGQLQAWASFLETLALIAADESAYRILTDPRIDREEKSQWLIDLCKECKVLDESRTHFIKLLAEKHRLQILPVLSDVFQEYKREYEKSVLIQVRSAKPLTDKQKQKLADVLKKRYNRDVKLTTDVDPTLIGGLVINAGDEVIDGTLRGQLHRLQTQLANPYQ